jgi:hypothetical protein
MVLCKKTASMSFKNVGPLFSSRFTLYMMHLFVSQTPLFLELNSKKNWGSADLTFGFFWRIFNLNSIIISRVLGILASQNRFQSKYDETFNI